MRLVKRAILEMIEGRYVLFTKDDYYGRDIQVKLNSGEAFLWDQIENVIDKNKMVDAYYNEFIVSRELASRHVDQFLNQLVDMGILSLR